MDPVDEPGEVAEAAPRRPDSVGRLLADLLIALLVVVLLVYVLAALVDDFVLGTVQVGACVLAVLATWALRVRLFVHRRR